MKKVTNVTVQSAYSKATRLNTELLASKAILEKELADVNKALSVNEKLLKELEGGK
jgi:hypothetical protein